MGEGQSRDKIVVDLVIGNARAPAPQAVLDLLKLLFVDVHLGCASRGPGESDLIRSLKPPQLSAVRLDLAKQLRPILDGERTVKDVAHTGIQPQHKAGPGNRADYAPKGEWLAPGALHCRGQ